GTVEIGRVGPQGADVSDSFSDRDSALVNSMLLSIVSSQIDAQRMIGNVRLYRAAWWIEYFRIPVKVQPGIVIPVVRVALPVTRQPDPIGSFVEAADAHQFGTQSALHSLEHELVELTVKQRADLTFDF